MANERSCDTNESNESSRSYNRSCSSRMMWFSFWLIVLTSQTLGALAMRKAFSWAGKNVAQTTGDSSQSMKGAHWGFVDYKNLNMCHHIVYSTITMILIATGSLLFRALNFNSPSYVVGHHIFCFLLTPVSIYGAWVAAQNYLKFCENTDPRKMRKHLQSFHCYVGLMAWALLAIQFFYALKLFCMSCASINRKLRYRKWHKFIGIAIFFLMGYNAMHGITTIGIDNFGSNPGGYNTTLNNSQLQELQTIKIYYASYISTSMLLMMYPMDKLC